jgi:uncharacterized protein
MRRKDREVTDFDEMIGILERCPVGHLALSDGDRAYVVPLNFAWRVQDGKMTVYFHCAKEGRKIDLLRKNPNACFEADCSFSVVKGSTACRWSALYESVIGAGRAALAEDPEEKKEAFDLLMKRYGFEGTPVYGPAELAEVAVIRLELEHISGKQKL